MRKKDINKRSKEGPPEEGGWNARGNGEQHGHTSHASDDAKLWRQNVVLRLALLQANLMGLENEMHRMEKGHPPHHDPSSPQGDVPP